MSRDALTFMWRHSNAAYYGYYSGFAPWTKVTIHQMFYHGSEALHTLPYITNWSRRMLASLTLNNHNLGKWQPCSFYWYYTGLHNRLLFVSHNLLFSVQCNSICARNRVSVNTVKPGQNGHHFPDDIFECIFLNQNVLISIKNFTDFCAQCSN